MIATLVKVPENLFLEGFDSSDPEYVYYINYGEGIPNLVKNNNTEGDGKITFKLSLNMKEYRIWDFKSSGVFELIRNLGAFSSALFALNELIFAFFYSGFIATEARRILC